MEVFDSISSSNFYLFYFIFYSIFKKFGVKLLPTQKVDLPYHCREFQYIPLDHIHCYEVDKHCLHRSQKLGQEK